MKNIITSIFGSSPRTTIMGYVQAILLGLVPVIQKEEFDIRTDWIWLLLAMGRAIAGRVGKDSDSINRKEGKTVHEVVKENILPFTKVS
ncbi:MAG: hypothetical protein WKF91_14460 [Segetibacter sp.]